MFVKQKCYNVKKIHLNKALLEKKKEKRKLEGERDRC